MAVEIEDLMRQLVRLEDEIERRLEAQQAEFSYRMDRNRAVFEAGVVRRQKLIKVGMLTFLRNSRLATLVIAPAVYGLIVPLVLLDLAVSVYMLVCFSAWSMERVRRADYVIVDRHRLAYLNGIEKLNCVFCGYANGVIAYAREAASRTEQYWCPIKHALRLRSPHGRYRGFVAYGDGEGFRARLGELREQARLKDMLDDSK
ncbi:MAG: hypothetical protein RIM80_07945 [Alphaproteobacteria bacterium]